jgi:hypothetical protein
MDENPPRVSYSENDLERVNFAQAVLHRPNVYTLYGSFGEVIAFLNGWYGGIFHHRRLPENISNTLDAEWYGFCQWLSSRSTGERPRFWEDYREAFGSDEEAIEDMKRLYEEYLAETASKVSLTHHA